MRRDLVVFFLATCLAFAQAPNKFVTVDIAVVGAHGNPVPDVRGSDIEIFDNKKPQAVAYWHSNEQAPHATVVVFSLEHAGIKSAAWKEAVGAMRRFETSEYLYFYLLTNSGLLFPVHALPEQADSPPANLPWMDQSLPRFESSGNFRLPPWVGMFNSKPDNGEILDYSQYMELAAKLSTFPGRKSLICVGCLLSNLSQAAVATKLRQLADAFRQARVAVYVVGGLGGSRYLASQVNADVDVTHVDLIDGFARATGGVAYAHGEVDQAIRHAIDDGKSSYRAAYLPGAENWDRKPHRIRIVSTRRDVRVSAPAWYFADPLEDVAREWKPAIPDYLITSPFDQSDIAISVSPPEKIASTVHMQVRVNAADVLLLPRDGRYYGSLALQALCYTPDGRKLACTEPLRVKLDLSPQERETVLRGGVRVPLTLTSSESFGRIRVVVYDPNSGAAGSSTLPVAETH